MTKIKKKHGGARPRTGRRMVTEVHRRQSFSCMVHPTTRKTLMGLSEKHDLSLGHILDRLVCNRRTDALKECWYKLGIARED